MGRLLTPLLLGGFNPLHGGPNHLPTRSPPPPSPEFKFTSLRIQPSARRIHIHTSREKGALGMGSGMDSGSELRRSGKAQSLPRTGPTKTVWFLVLDLELEIGSVRCGDTIVLCLTWSRKQVLFDVATRLIGFLYLT